MLSGVVSITRQSRALAEAFLTLLLRAFLHASKNPLFVLTFAFVIVMAYSLRHFASSMRFNCYQFVTYPYWHLGNEKSTHVHRGYIIIFSKVIIAI